MSKINIDYNNPNIMALEITKLIFHQNPNLMKKDDSRIITTSIFLKEYAIICDCLKEIKKHPELISDKED